MKEPRSLRRLATLALAPARQVVRALRALARWARERRAREAVDRVFDATQVQPPPKRVRPVYFFGSYELSSFRLGGFFPVEALKRMGVPARSGEGLDPQRLQDAILVFVREQIAPDLDRIKSRGNRIVIDMRDNFVQPEGALNATFIGRDVADVLIFPNHALLDAFNTIRPTSSRCTVLHGYADPSITDSVRQHGLENTGELRVGYFGFPSNLHDRVLDASRGLVPFETIALTDTDFLRHLPRLRRCNLHVDVRAYETSVQYKPLTKILVAAECRSNIVVQRSPRVLELLPPDYPFLVDDQDVGAAFRRAREMFGTPAWKHALTTMERIQTACSFQNHMNGYLRMLEELSCD